MPEKPIYWLTGEKRRGKLNQRVRIAVSSDLESLRITGAGLVKAGVYHKVFIGIYEEIDSIEK